LTTNIKDNGLKKVKAALHLHSIRSDGVHLPSVIVGYAKLVDIKVLSITDHNEIKGTLAAAKLARKLGIIYYPGIELTFTVSGRVYELLAYFYTEKEITDFYAEYRFQNGFMPSFKSVSSVIKLVRKFEGAVIAPHPFGRKGVYRKGRNRKIKVDGIEVINAFTGEKRNLRAERHVENHSYLEFGAADMHFFLHDINKTYTEISGQNINKKEVWNNLLGKQKTLRFRPVGKKFPTYKITFQKPLCGLSYVLNYPRNYFGYRAGKKASYYHLKNR
jgi:predicted metal-dependent phosphoesterase TrpH